VRDSQTLTDLRALLAIHIAVPPGTDREF